MLLITLPDSLSTITALINHSLVTSVFPEAWKSALVTPLPKKSSVTQFQDLRPVSILPCMSKILERVVHMQLSSYMEENDILPVRQSGFRKSHSTATALLDITDNIVTAQDRGMGTIMVLLDYSRAFDAINIPLLLSKMAYYGFGASTISWFTSYLSGRSQKVKLVQSDGGCMFSVTSPVTRGVPQGSILGPLLFTLYTADIVTVIRHCQYHMYADDTQIYLSFHPKDTALAVDKINQDLVNITSWSESNTLVLNPNKTKLIIFGTPEQIRKVASCNPVVKIMNEQVERVSEARNLGVLMDESLRFEKHVLEVVKTCFYRLKILYRIRNYLSVDLRIRLCDALILSKMSYADLVYGPRLLARTEKMVQRIQNACARFCFKIPPRTHVTPFLNAAGILRMTLRREHHLATLLFETIKTGRPIYLFEKLDWRGSNSRPCRTVSWQLRVPSHGSAAFRGSFKYSATKCWNNLPPPLRQLKSKHCFKLQHKKYLLLRQNDLPVGSRVYPTYLSGPYT